MELLSFLVTHNVLEAEKAVDRVAIMHKGKIITLGTPQEVKRSVKHFMRVEISVIKEMERPYIPSFVQSFRRNGPKLILTIHEEDVSSCIDWIKQNMEKEIVLDYAITPSTLEDVYVELTTKGGVFHDANDAVI